MSQPIDYTMRYQIRSGRINFANYVQRRQLVQDGTLLGLNLYPPDHDASIVPIIKDGATFTTQAEYDGYLGQISGSAPEPAPAPGPSFTVPGAPTSVSRIAGNTQVVVYFTAPVNNGGTAITGYTVTSSPGGFTATGSASPLTVTGLTNGTAYTFTVIATNSIGNSAASSASPAVTPNTVVPGIAKLAASFFDDANAGYTNLNNTFSQICTDTATNVIVASYARTSTYTLDKPDTDGITQIQVSTTAFVGTTNFVQGATYYTYNMFITKYSASGVPVWSSQIGGDTNKANTIYGVACDSANNVYALVGHGASIITYYNADGSVFGTINNTFAFGNSIPARYALIKYDSTGQIQYINSYTAGDTNNQFVLITGGSLAVDNSDNVYVSCQVQRAGGGSGATSIKFYQYTGVSGGVVQLNLITSDSYAFGGSPAEYHRGLLVKLSSAGAYTWVARMVMPTAYGENNGGTVNTNIAVDSTNNVYLCMNGTNGSSPICNIYSGVSAASNPLPALSAPYYRIDLRGNSISPSLPQYYKFAAVAKFNSSGVFQRMCCTHALVNSSSSFSMIPQIGIDKTTDSVFLAVNAQGFVGTNAGSGAQLNTLSIDSFVANNANGANYDIGLSTTFTMPLAQPSFAVVVINFDSSLAAQSVAYIDTPSGNGGSGVSIDSTGNIYLATTIANTTATKTIYTFNALAGSVATFNTFGTVAATATTTDGLLVSYSGDLQTARWATTITSSDGLNEAGLLSAVDTADNIYFGGTSIIDAAQPSNYISINNYDTVSGGAVQTTLFGNMDVSAATDRVGYLIKYS